MISKNSWTKKIKKMNKESIKKIFETNRVDFPDDGFSDRVIRQLPYRKNMLPQIVMVVFTMTGLVLTFAIQGVTPLLEQINSLIISISNLQAPSPGSVIAYIGALGVVGFIGFAVAHADAG